MSTGETMNILWITTDQQQWQTIAGRSACRMPGVQRLVDSGVVFTRAYAPAPVCCPVRAMWVSGQYPWHNGVHTQVHSAPSLTLDMYPDVQTYSQRLKAAGYRQGFVGKWHASATRTPLDFGFDEIDFPSAYGAGTLKGIPLRCPRRPTDNAHMPYTPERMLSWPGSEPFAMWGCHDGPVSDLDSTHLANASIAMLERFAAGGRPWHISLHFPEPHDPYNPHREYLRRYDPGSLPVPESFRDTFAGKPGMHRREAGIWGEVGEADVRQALAHYFAYCEQIDEQIGRILDALEASGQAGDTLVAFTSDHGDMMGAHHMWSKSWMPYEEIYRMPLVVRLPGAAKGVCHRLVQTHDLPHTFLDLLGLPPLPYADGRSLKPLLSDPAGPGWEDAVLSVGYGCEFFVTQRLLVTGRYKYVFNGFDFDELYDLQEDPGEMRNLIDEPGLGGVRSELRAKLYELMNRHGDPYGDRGTPGGRLFPPNRYHAPRYLPRS